MAICTSVLIESNQPDKLIEELREAISARDDFLAVATHELRNPLTPILLCLKLIRTSEESKDHAKVMQELDRLERQIKHFIARTTILLEVAQIASGKFHLDPSKLNLSELIGEVVNDCMPLAVRSGSALNVGSRLLARRRGELKIPLKESPVR